jgi:hypothetical protein
MIFSNFHKQVFHKLSELSIYLLLQIINKDYHLKFKQQSTQTLFDDNCLEYNNKIMIHNNSYYPNRISLNKNNKERKR